MSIVAAYLIVCRRLQTVADPVSSTRNCVVTGITADQEIYRLSFLHRQAYVCYGRWNRNSESFVACTMEAMFTWVNEIDGAGTWSPEECLTSPQPVLSPESMNASPPAEVESPVELAPVQTFTAEQELLLDQSPPVYDELWQAEIVAPTEEEDTDFALEYYPTSSTQVTAQNDFPEFMSLNHGEALPE